MIQFSGCEKGLAFNYPFVKIIIDFAKLIRSDSIFCVGQDMNSEESYETRISCGGDLVLLDGMG